ncbi:MAG: Trm112 family protein [Parvibaculales bacterium]
MSMGGETPKRKLDPAILELLVCPVSHGPLSYDEAADELISKEAKLAYPVRDGIPIMLPDEARALDK